MERPFDDGWRPGEKVRLWSHVPVAGDRAESARRITPRIERDNDHRGGLVSEVPLCREYVRDDERADRFAVAVSERDNDRPPVKTIERNRLRMLIVQCQCRRFVVDARERRRNFAIRTGEK